MRRGAGGKWEGKGPVRDLLADGRCSQAALDFLSTTDAGRLVPAEEDAGSEVSEWERREQKEEKRAEAEEVGVAGELAAGEGPPLLPKPSFMASVGEN